MSAKKRKKQQYQNGDKGIISQVFEETVRQARKFPKDKNYFPCIYDLTGAVLKRREAAAFSVLKQVKERYGNQYQDMNLAENMAFMCSDMSFSAELTEFHNYIALAAAMFMLDAIKETDSLSRAFEYFSTDEMTVEFVCLPELFYDPCHQDEVLKGMVCLIDNRMRDSDWRKKFYNEVSAKDTGSAPAEIKEPSDTLTFKERFDAVFSMVPQVYKDRAMKRFADKLWEFIDLYFENAYSLFRQEQDIAQKSESIFAQCEALQKELDQRKRNTFAPPTVPSVMAKQAPQLPLLDKDYFQRSHSDLNRISTLANQGLALQDKLDELEMQRGTLSFTAAAAFRLSDFSHEDQEDVKSYAFYGQVLEMTVEDPYEICFGFLCHLAAGSDLVWLYNPALAVLECAAAHLPWTVHLPDDDEDDDLTFRMPEIVDDDPSEDSGTPGEYNPRDLNHLKAALYAREYTDATLYCPMEPPEELKKVNLPQLVYGYTHAVMPRDIYFFEGISEDLMKSGLEKAPAMIMEYYLQLAHSAQYESKNWRYFLRTQSFKDLNDSVFEALEDDETDNTVDKDAEIARLKRTNDELKQSLYAVSRKLRELEAEREAAAMQHERERLELADLREIVFLSNTGEEPAEPRAKAISLPYTTKKRTVVFGGHDTWSNAIRPMLPNVTFVDKRMSPNENLIRHADVIWIQTNALGHHHFYKLIDVCRTWRIPVRYFKYASAEKCARQLAEYDLEISR